MPLVESTTDAGGRAVEGTWTPSPAADPFAQVPLMGTVAALAAFIDLALNRLAIRSLGESFPRHVMLELSRLGELPQNFAAVAGIVAVTLALGAFLRSSRAMPVRLRLGIAAFAGIFLPTIVLATVLPPNRTSDHMVLFATGAGLILTTLINTAAIRNAAPTGVRIASGAAAAAAALAFLGLLGSLVRPFAHWSFGLEILRAMRAGGEFAYFAVFVAALAGLAQSPHRPRASRGGIAAAILASAAALAALVVCRSELGGELDTVLYGALRVELFLDGHNVVYVVLLALTVGAAIVPVINPVGIHRQLGVALLLWLSAGFAPRTPGRLLMFVLAATLLCRCALALGRTRVAGRAALAQPTSATAPDSTRATSNGAPPGDDPNVDLGDPEQDSRRPGVASMGALESIAEPPLDEDPSAAPEGS